MPEKIERQRLDYEHLSKKWAQVDTNYTKQYCSIYLIRLKQMTAILEERIKEKWGTEYPITKLHKLSEENHQKCVVIGTLFKDQKLKPSILKQLAESNQLVPQPIVTHFTDKSDKLFIEDELQRYQIVGALHCEDLVTGVSCALLGTNDDKGRFIAEDYLFANLRPQIPPPLIEKPSHILFLSGLDLINSANFDIHLNILEQWLNGLVDSPHLELIRVIIAGNSVRINPEEVPSSISLLSRRPEASDTIETTKILDKFLLGLSRVVEVDIMPGENDPTNQILPQKPMHRCMFPQASTYKSFNQVPNPYYFSLGGLKILGSSGQPVRDILRFSEVENALDALECCLKWNHLAPTAPDTLGCFPFYESDPFIIEECPHVFFAGNQSEFSTRVFQGDNGQQVRLIGVPEFGTKLEGCLLNLQSLDCIPVNFKSF